MALPAPYPADTRAKGWRFEIDYEKVEQSDTWDLATEVPMAQPALLMMWLMAWTQAPCGSLPNDENLIRVKCRIPAKSWPALRPILMRGWYLAEDGRLYEAAMTQRVLEMIGERQRKGYLKFKAAVLQKHGEWCFYCGASGCELTLELFSDGEIVGFFRCDDYRCWTEMFF